MKKLLLSVSVLLALFVNGCGGGGSAEDGGVSANPPALEYDLRTYIDKSSFIVEGTIEGENTPVIYSSEYIESKDYLGTLLDIHENVLSINAIEEISYTGTYLGNIYTVEGPSRSCEIADGHTLPTPVPTNATIGYVSDPVHLACTDGATFVVYFELQDGGEDNALLVATSIIYINGEALVAESISTVDKDMNLLAYEMRIGSDIHFKATSITQY